MIEPTTVKTGLTNGCCLVVAICVVVAAASAVAQSPSEQLQPARAGLRAVPLPRLDTLEAAVATQMREEQRSFQTLASDDNPQSGKLAAAYGSLGRVLHAYEFFESAEAAYLNAIQLAPGAVAWRHLLGYLYQQTGRLDNAEAQFAQALRIQPDDRAAAIRLGQVYLGLNRLREAREQFQAVEPNFPTLARQGLGEVALRERRFSEAIEHFRAVLARAPQASSIHYSLAMAYRGAGRLDEARTHLQQRGPGAINVGDPIVDDLDTLIRGERGLVAQGRRAYDAGDFKAAATAFAKAIEAEPESVTAKMNLGLAQLQLGNANEAVQLLQQAFALSPEDPDVARELTRLLLRLRRNDEAIVVLTKARTVNPDDEETMVGLAILLAGENRFREAFVLLDDGHRRFAERSATATTLARLLASSPDRSIRDGQRALTIAMQVYDAAPMPVHGETVALALAELGRCDEALAWMKRAVAEAERVDDPAELTRLKAEVPKYETRPCRP
jgi:tetratricopeptide (TPR) repeat protein